MIDITTIRDEKLQPRFMHTALEKALRLKYRLKTALGLRVNARNNLEVLSELTSLILILIMNNSRFPTVIIATILWQIMSSR